MCRLGVLLQLQRLNINDLTLPPRKGGRVTPLCYSDFPRMHDLADHVASEIGNSDALLFSEFPESPDNRLLVLLASLLAHEMPSAKAEPKINLESEFIHRVEPLADPARDPGGQLVISTSSQHFPLHTDQYLNPHPADLVIFHCVNPAENGGETLLSFVRHFLPLLDQEDIKTLSEKSFPAGRDQTSILSFEKDQCTIRYNPEGLSRSCVDKSYSLAHSAQQALAELERVASSVTVKFKLSKHDLLILNNRTVLHGRTSFTGSRLLKRVRLRLKNRFTLT